MNENERDFVKCPYCKLYFRPDKIIVKHDRRNKRNKHKYFVCERCGNDFRGGYYNKWRDTGVQIVDGGCIDL